MSLALKPLALGIGALISGMCVSHATDWRREVFYQIFPRSFRDSNGDRIGDLKGIESELPYLQRLGVTALLINPIVASRTYHNYFADDWYKVDPEFGTNSDFFHLIGAAHRRGMKVVLDAEFQYVADKHPWYKAWKQGTGNLLWPGGAYWPNLDAMWWDKQIIRFEPIDPLNPVARRGVLRAFRYWAAPGGNWRLGVDGFRLDHMMDDFEWKHVKTRLLSRFWTPILAGLRAAHPGLFFMGEQADWSSGANILAMRDMNAVFAFGLQSAILSLDPSKIGAALKGAIAATKAPKTQITFLENHDTERFASKVNGDPRVLRLGAALLLTQPFTPSIYYGQEIGMKGMKGDWKSDGNDIPDRLAMRWSSTLGARGTAVWYKGSGPWALPVYSKDHDGISVEEERGRSGSLLETYRRLIALRKREPALSSGALRVLAPRGPILCYERTAARRRVLVLANTGGKVASTRLADRVAHWLVKSDGVSVAGDVLRLPAYGYAILERGA